MKHAPLVLPARCKSPVPPSCGKDQCVHHVHKDSVQAQMSLAMRPWVNKSLNETLHRCAVRRVSLQAENNIAAFPLELLLGKRTWTI